MVNGRASQPSKHFFRKSLLPQQQCYAASRSTERSSESVTQRSENVCTGLNWGTEWHKAHCYDNRTGPGSFPKEGIECERANLPTSHHTAMSGMPSDSGHALDTLAVDWKEGFPGERHIVVEAGDGKKRIEKIKCCKKQTMAQNGIGEGQGNKRC
jgi:hypothetical protein